MIPRSAAQGVWLEMRRLFRWRPSSGKKLTFLYVPDDADVRQFRVPQSAFYGVAGAVLFGFGLLGFFGIRYIGALSEGREMLRIQAENEALRQRVEAIEGQMESLDLAMSQSREVQERLRLLSTLQPIHEEVFEVGIGGPRVRDDSGSLPEDLVGDLDHVSGRISHMLRQASVHRESFEEILTTLRTKQQVWDRTPSVRPVRTGFITGRYGRRMDPFTGQAAMHRGIDIAAHPGATVFATADGVVNRAGLRGGYGLVVEIDHGDGLISRYAHCSKLLVEPGQRVRRGDRIARVGSTGKATGSHVHYEVTQHGLPQDPMKFILQTDVVVD